MFNAHGCRNTLVRALPIFPSKKRVFFERKGHHQYPANVYENIFPTLSCLQHQMEGFQLGPLTDSWYQALCHFFTSIISFNPCRNPRRSYFPHFTDEENRFPEEAKWRDSQALSHWARKTVPVCRCICLRPVTCKWWDIIIWNSYCLGP